MDDEQCLNPSTQTDLSLLERLSDRSQRSDAWVVFVERYTRMISAWCEHWGVDPATEEDVLQETMLRVLDAIDIFERRRQGSFRTWLRKLAHSSWVHLNRQKERQMALRPVDVNADAAWGRLISKAGEDHLTQLCDRWATQELLEMSARRVRRRVGEETWRIYAEIVENHRSVEDVRKECGLALDTIYNRVFRVRKLLRQEYEILDANEF
jgi:RNA polymerase sigma factor (sigma-70 family)